MEELWRERKEGAPAASLQKKWGPLLSQFLWQRDIVEEKEVEDFINPKLSSLRSPYELKNLKESAERLGAAVTDGQKICVYGDYDIDGTCGMHLLYSFLQQCCAKKEQVSYLQPDRFSDGYGVHPELIEKLKKQGVEVIVTVDTGITAFEGVRKAQQLGLDVIITDHHKQTGDLPATDYIVNPNQDLDKSSLSYLCGAGVAFYLAIAVRGVLKKQAYFKAVVPDIRQWLDLFVLGTISDVVDLVDQNRLLSKHGLRRLRQTERIGLKALVARSCDLEQELKAEDVGFRIGPRLNATSRMGRSELFSELLVCTDEDRAQKIVDEVFTLNEKRKAIQEECFKEALVVAEAAKKQNTDLRVLVVQGPWHEGVIGIVAAKLCEKYKCPCAVLAVNKEKGTAKASMRNFASLFSSVKLLEACSDLLLKFGGHPAAAGFEIELAKISDFNQKINQAADDYAKTQADQEHFCYYDGELPKDISLLDVKNLSKAEPFGKGNSTPLFLLKNFECEWSKIKIMKELHFKASTPEGFDLLAFSKVEALKQMLNGRAKLNLDLLVVPEINVFRGRAKIQMRVERMQESL